MTPMGSAPTGNPAATPAAFVIEIEAVSYVNQFVGGSGAGTLELAVAAVPGDTLRTVLQKLCGQHPRLREVLWDKGSLGPHIEIVVNGEVLGGSRTLESPAQPGDKLMLIGQYIGG